MSTKEDKLMMQVSPNYSDHEIKTSSHFPGDITCVESVCVCVCACWNKWKQLKLVVDMISFLLGYVYFIIIDCLTILRMFDIAHLSGTAVHKTH